MEPERTQGCIANSSLWQELWRELARQNFPQQMLRHGFDLKSYRRFDMSYIGLMAVLLKTV
jgi:hypothetical protein